MSIRAWCRRHGVPASRFYRWRIRLGLAPLRKPRACDDRPVEFARVLVQESAGAIPGAGCSGEPIRLTLLGGRQLLLPAALPLEQILGIVRGIEAGVGAMPPADGRAAAGLLVQPALEMS
jgi:hypothetical protein